MKKFTTNVFIVASIGLSACEKPLANTSQKYPDIKTAYRYPQVGKCVCPYDRTKTGKLCEDESEYAQKQVSTPLCYLSDLE
jgi:hypothetical protein